MDDANGKANYESDVIVGKVKNFVTWVFVCGVAFIVPNILGIKREIRQACVDTGRRHRAIDEIEGSGGRSYFFEVRFRQSRALICEH